MKNILSLSNISVGKKINLIIIGAFIALVGVSAFLLNEYRNTMFEERQIKTQNLVETAHSAITAYVQQYKSGLLSEEEAKISAMNAIKPLRYDDNNYFWINDTHPKMVMHPLKPALNGKDLSDFQDIEGNYLFNDIVAAVAKDGQGFVPYAWAKPGGDPETSFPKLSYVKAIPEWGWIVGSGIYIDDVDAAFKEHLINIAIIECLLLIIIGLFSWIVGRNIKLPLSRLSEEMHDLADGKDIVVSDQDRNDEIGTMGKALDELNEKLRAAKALEAEQKEREKQAEIEKKQAMQNLAIDFNNQVGSMINALAAAASQLQSTAKSMRSIADDTSRSSQRPRLQYRYRLACWGDWSALRVPVLLAVAADSGSVRLCAARFNRPRDQQKDDCL